MIQHVINKMLKILVVDDSDIFRRTFMDFLKERFPSYESEEARNGNEAIIKTKEFSPDLIFLDVKLPGASGLELAREIKITNPDIAIVIVTNYDLPEYRDKAKENGADLFLSKTSLSEERIVNFIETVITECHSCTTQDVRKPL